MYECYKMAAASPSDPPFSWENLPVPQLMGNIGEREFWGLEFSLSKPTHQKANTNGDQRTRVKPAPKRTLTCTLWRNQIRFWGHIYPNLYIILLISTPPICVLVHRFQACLHLQSISILLCLALSFIQPFQIGVVGIILFHFTDRTTEGQAISPIRAAKFYLCPSPLYPLSSE